MIDIIWTKDDEVLENNQRIYTNITEVVSPGDVISISSQLTITDLILDDSGRYGCIASGGYYDNNVTRDIVMLMVEGK